MPLNDDLMRVRRVYAAALERDPEERNEYLERACVGDPELRAKVADLIARHAGDFRETIPFDTVASSPTNFRQDVGKGRIIGPYIVRRELGRGGMGVVYLADDTRLARRVALKSLSPGLDHGSGGRERLRAEARTAAALSHPGIATVYALEEIDNQLYLACEYVPGQPLRALLEFGPLPIAQVVTIGAQLAKALAAAHTMGIVHRDIKPENIVKTPSGVIKVLDFGLARMGGDAHPNPTQTGVILGTPAYLAPEQALGGTVDFRTDLFAFGLVIYELATGMNPFMASTVTATIARIVEEDLAPLASVQPLCPPELDEIVATCLRKDPLDRYKSTRKLVADFELLEAKLSTLRQRHSDRRHQIQASDPRPVSAQPAALWWWEFHQIAVSAIYALMIYPAWSVRRTLPPPWGMLFVFAVLASAAWATSLRLHLRFVARLATRDLVAQRMRILPWLRAADTGFALSLFIGAIAIGSGQPEFAMLFITIAIAALVGSLVIEPATARAAFGDVLDGQR
jgi:serine/threonine protein kinase